jgi:hypothetical protein
MYPNFQQIQLCKIFTWRGWGYIVALNQPKPAWTTPKIPLHSGILIDAYIDPSKLIGIGFDRTTDYLMSDIDRGSPYHPLNNWTRFKDFLKLMRSIGLTGRIVIRSSDNGGIHIYFPLPKYVDSLDLAIAAKVASIDDGFEVANGKLEFFPNVKNGGGHTRHRLPLQPDSGSCLLDDNGKPLDISASVQLGTFMQAWEDVANEQDMRLLSRKIRQLGDKYNRAKNWTKYKLDRSAVNSDGSGAEFSRSLDRLIEIGWTMCDQTQFIVRHLLKKAIIFLRLTGDDAVNWIVSTARTMPGYDQYCNHRHDIRRVAASWVRSCESKNYYLPYCAHPDRDGQPLTVKNFGSPNNSNYQHMKHEARQRIDAAVMALSQLPTEYCSIESLILALQDMTKKMFGLTVSRSTLRKHDHLWHPKLRDWITMPVENGSDSGSSQTDTCSDINLVAQNQKSNPETQTGHGLDHHADPILCMDDPAGNLPLSRRDDAEDLGKGPIDPEPTSIQPPPLELGDLRVQPEVNVLSPSLLNTTNLPPDDVATQQINHIVVHLPDLDPPPTADAKPISSPVNIPTIRPYQPRQIHTHNWDCPECKIPTPAAELERWDVCRFCEQKKSWQRQI